MLNVLRQTILKDEAIGGHRAGGRDPLHGWSHGRNFFFEVNKLLISFDFNFVFVCNYLFIYFYLSRVIDSHRIGHFRVLSFLMTSFLFKHNFNLHFFNREA